MPQKCPCPGQNLLAQTVYPLQGSKVHPNFENKKKFSEKHFLCSTTTRKICWIHWWNPFLNLLTINGDICNFVTAVSALSNKSHVKLLMGDPMTELLSVTCHKGSHSVTCYPTQVNAPRPNPSQPGRYSIYLPRRDGRLSRPRSTRSQRSVYN